MTICVITIPASKSIQIGDFISTRGPAVSYCLGMTQVTQNKETAMKTYRYQDANGDLLKMNTCTDCGRTPCVTYRVQMMPQTQERMAYRATESTKAHRCRACIEAHITKLEANDAPRLARNAAKKAKAEAAHAAWRADFDASRREG